MDSITWVEDRKKTKKNFQERGVKYADYCEKHKLCIATLSLVLNGKIKGKSGSGSGSRTYQVVEQLKKDGIWCGPTPWDESQVMQDIIKVPFSKPYFGAGLGDFEKKTKSFIFSPILMSNPQLNFAEKIVIGVIDAHTGAGACRLSDEQIGKMIGVDIGEVAQIIDGLKSENLVNIITTNKTRHMVINAGKR